MLLHKKNYLPAYFFIKSNRAFYNSFQNRLVYSFCGLVGVSYLGLRFLDITSSIKKY